MTRSIHHNTWAEKVANRSTATTAAANRSTAVPKQKEKRTSFTAMLNHDVYSADTRLQPLFRRIAAAIGLTASFVRSNLEMQIVRYKPGQYYRPHLDTTGSGAGGRRWITIFSYLNDVESGGETALVKLEPPPGGVPYDKSNEDACAGLTVAPERGSAVMWYNFRRGVVDERMYHAGCDVKAGVKYGANMWIHDTLSGGRLAETEDSSKDSDARRV